MLGSLGRMRGSAEATWVSLLGTACALALILAARSLRGDTPQLAAPFDRAAVYLTVAAATALAMLLVIRGDVASHYVVTGLFGLAFIFGAAALAPRIGVALFLSAAIAGQLIGALVLDHIGAFGVTQYAVNPTRLLGAGLLLAGVVLVRGVGR
jgi:hypothetical protein